MGRISHVPGASGGAAVRADPARDAAPIRRAVSLLPAGHGYQPLEWKAKRFAQRWDDEPRTRHLRWMSNVDLPDLRRAVHRAGTCRCASTAPCGAMRGDVLDEILALDFETYLPGSVLTKVDRASMAHGLEVRPPMLDNSLIDFACSLPASVRMRGGRSKALLRRSLQWAGSTGDHPSAQERVCHSAGALDRWAAAAAGAGRRRVKSGVGNGTA